jgi:hypothetical protein
MYAQFTKAETLVHNSSAAGALIDSRSPSDVAGARLAMDKALWTGTLYARPISETSDGVEFEGHTFHNRECLVAYVLAKFW